LKVIVDTNVVLDVLLDREPFGVPAAALFALAEQSKIEAFLCATTITTIDYLLKKSLSRKDARNALHKLLEIFQIAPVNRAVIEEALQSALVDFEDAVLAHAGHLMGAKVVVTRNIKDFNGSVLAVMDPSTLISTLNLRNNLM
jgi:predicted nucleic acid-binding protein